MTTGEVGVKERVLSWIVNRALASSNKHGNIADLQRRHGAYAEQVTRLEVTDLGRVWQFRVRAGKFEMVPPEVKAEGGLRTTSDTLIAITLGRRRVGDPGSGKSYDVPYTPLIALKYGDLEVWGDASTNSALLFAREIYKEIYPQIRADLRPGVEAAVPGSGGQS